MNRIDVLGVEFDDMDIVAAVELAMGFMEERRCAYAVTPNPEIVLECRKNRKLAAAVRAADMVLPDGVGVIYASRILGTPIKNRLPGIDFASALMARMSECGKKVFLLGAKSGVAELAAERLTERYPGLEICGVNDGYFAQEDNELVLEKINALSPDLILVCLGAPRQEIWMKNNAELLNAGLMIGLGGAMDVYAGVVERAPRKWRKLGLEWLYRLIKEPRRIKRMIKLPGILFAALWRRIGG
ncbi:MAG: WecB/TagA/CpsF family glycosyltransferase [Clostridiales bacterium]|nr:WecB/TagA/CpsF family glycosyltransferase [Clostridiales bacterium]